MATHKAIVAAINRLVARVYFAFGLILDTSVLENQLLLELFGFFGVES